MEAGAEFSLTGVVPPSGLKKPTLPVASGGELDRDAILSRLVGLLEKQSSGKVPAELFGLGSSAAATAIMCQQCGPVFLSVARCDSKSLENQCSQGQQVPRDRKLQCENSPDGRADS